MRLEGEVGPLPSSFETRTLISGLPEISLLNAQVG